MERLSGALLAAFVLAFVAGVVAQQRLWRMRCPACQELFFARNFSTRATWAGFPKQENCDRCRFNLYRADNIGREAP